MIMSAPPILASDRRDNEMRAALAAGWRRSDLWWERLEETGNRAFLAGDLTAAARAFGRAGWIARLTFAKGDPRRTATLANLAQTDRAQGREARARRRLLAASMQWHAVGGFIDTMNIARRARSSLFHLRMEALHWDTYTDNTRVRFRAFASETDEALAAMQCADPVPHRLFERWRGEKPSVFDDTRKFLAGALLIAGGRTSDAKPAPTEP